MNERGSFAAALLDASRRAYAAGAVQRLSESGDDATDLVETWGFQELVSDMELRLEHLAEALAAGRAELFALDTAWLAETYAARGVDRKLLDDLLGALRDELREEMPKEAGELAAEYVERGIAALGASSSIDASLLKDGDPHVDVAREFLAAVRETDRLTAERVILDALEAGVPIVELHTHVVSRVQAEIGRLWQRGDIHTAAEHFGSRIIEDVLARLRAALPIADAAARKAVVASVAGNLHDIGARLVADRFEASGWRAIYLGANMPQHDLVDTVVKSAPDVVALSAGLVINVRSVARTIEALRDAGVTCPILVGGRPFSLVEGLWRDVGADGYAVDAGGAVELAGSLASTR